jgi:hypothetical protein
MDQVLQKVDLELTKAVTVHGIGAAELWYAKTGGT